MISILFHYGKRGNLVDGLNCGIPMEESNFKISNDGNKVSAYPSLNNLLSQKES